MEETQPIRTESVSPTINHGSFGATLKIGPKTHVSVYKEGAGKKYHVKSIEVLIGIGKDHTASLVMDVDAWEALKAGEKPDISTLKEFREKFL